MSTTDGSSHLSPEDLAREIVSDLPNNPLLIDVVNEVRTHRQLGMNDEQIREVLTEAFKLTDADYHPRDETDPESQIVINNLPSDYNKLDWR